MSLRVIPTQVHGVLDYLTGGALLAAPGLPAYRLRARLGKAATDARTPGSRRYERRLACIFALGITLAIRKYLRTPAEKGSSS